MRLLDAALLPIVVSRGGGPALLSVAAAATTAAVQDTCAGSPAEHSADMKAEVSRVRKECNELAMERTTESQTNEQQEEAVPSQRAVLEKKKWSKSTMALAGLQQQHADSVRAREAQMQLRVGREETVRWRQGHGRRGHCARTVCMRLLSAHSVESEHHVATSVVITVDMWWELIAIFRSAMQKCLESRHDWCFHSLGILFT